MERPKPSLEAGFKPIEVNLHPGFSHTSYEIQRKVLKAYTTFDVSDDEGNFLMRTQKEPSFSTDRFHTYGDKDNEKELLAFKTRGSIPKVFDVGDPATGENIGSIRHNLLNSVLRTNWDILSPIGEKLGTMRQVKIAEARRRFGAKALLHPTYEIVSADESGVATLEQKSSLGGLKFKATITDEDPSIDRRLIAAANIIVADREYIEGLKASAVA